MLPGCLLLLKVVSPDFSQVKNGDRPLPIFAVMLAGMMLLGTSGCHMILPDIGHQPVVHNPFPQLSRVAIAPFFNLSDEPTVDGRKFALSYFAELQAVPGFEVVPLGVVEEAILAHQVDLSRPEEARRLARVLSVDAVVIGSVTDYSAYYPPRCGMRIEWYAANPGFHEIPPGYGLPWGTPEEEFIPAPLVFEAEMALARAQLATQTPECQLPPEPAPPSARAAPAEPQAPPIVTPSDTNGSADETTGDANAPTASPDDGKTNGSEAGDANKDEAGANENKPAGELAALYDEQLPAGEIDPLRDEALPPGDSSAGDSSPGLLPDPFATGGTTGATVAHGALDQLPPDWPDERGFVPRPPSPVRPACCPNNGPIMTHTRIYHGTDSEFTEALASYYHFRDDARFGGWQNYLQRSDDFIRFCCHVHISEMLSARGGAGETRVVWRWSDSR
jgi:hypothetical protein